MDEIKSRGEARTLSMPVPGSNPHTLQILNREQVVIQGVLSVDSFDDQEIILETDLGVLTLKGEELHIKQLDLDSGKFAVDGFVSAVIYSTPRQRGSRQPKQRSFLERLLK